MKYVFICVTAAASVFANSVQTDWSGGLSGTGTVKSWTSFFSASEDISWLSLPGQISLSSTPLAVCTEEIVAQSIPLSALECCDVNGDGNPDIAGASLVSGHVWWFENVPSSGWVSHELPGEFGGALGCTFFDMDGDGSPDIIGGTSEPDQIILWRNIGGEGEFSQPLIIDSLFAGVHCVAGCYADDDSMADFMAAGNECNEIAVWYGLGDNQWEKVVIDAAFTGTQSVSPGDIDGDGDIDAVGAALGMNEFAWWANPGNRTDPWEKHSVAVGMTAAHHAVAVDMNGDGRLDVLGASFGNSKITWWENDGSSPPLWEAHTVAPGLTGVLTSLPGDFDGDNDIDVAGTSWSLDRIVWYENLDGIGESWQARTVTTGFNGAWPLACADFSGNGRIEIAAGADVLTGPGSSHGLSIFNVCAFTPSGWLESDVLDTEESPQWASFEFDADTPSGCALSFFWKSSDDPENLGEWFGPYSNWTDLSGLVHRFVQYRIEMTGSGELNSPVVREVLLNWDPSGIEGGWPVSELLDPMSNPLRGTVCFRIRDSLRGDAAVTVQLLTLCGRVVEIFSGCSAGQVIESSALPSGTYILRASLGASSYVGKVCLLN